MEDANFVFPNPQYVPRLKAPAPKNKAGVPDTGLVFSRRDASVVPASWEQAHL